MNLSPKQRAFLTLLEEGPIFASDRRYPAWPIVNGLWKKELIDVIGRSTYITEAGRAALHDIGGET